MDTGSFSIDKYITVPDVLLIVLLGVFAFVFYTGWIRKSEKQISGMQYRKAILFACFVIYMLFLLCVTLFSRSVASEPEAALVPLWSWRWIFENHDHQMLLYSVLNVVLMVPLGILLDLWKNMTVLRALLISLALSCIIETLQYFLHLGLFEWDDMIHNAIGCVLGLLLCRLLRRAHRR